MNVQPAIAALRDEWDLDSGFLGSLRLGIYKPDGLERLVNILLSIELDKTTVVDRRLVALVWYMPIFLVWQRERFKSQGREVIELDAAINRIEELIERILGVP